MAIPKDITREHILKALKEIDAKKAAADVMASQKATKPDWVRFESTKFDLVHNGRRYSPKYVLRVAGEHCGYQFHDLDYLGFSGGDETNRYFKERGFKILHKSGEEWKEDNEAKSNASGTKKSSDSQDERKEVIEEGEEGHKTSKSRKRSSLLLKKGREYFKAQEPDGKLRCKACGYTKPGSVRKEIVQLHHKKPISEMSERGEAIWLEAAIKQLVPLCPTCHCLIHAPKHPKPPMSVSQLKKLLLANKSRGKR